ncbi:MAG: DUF4303 domain-containing protein, partial [Muribaculaceae bacterium]|nr:DUF4303 domain-containing protein [Muribaculaceae bacterium]
QDVLGVVQDDDLALEYLQEAEEDIDDLWAPVNGMVLNALGVAYTFGRGTEEDVELGYQYFEDAARLGSEEAKEHLQLINSPEYDSVGQAACITPTKELDSFYSGLAKRVREAVAMDLQEVLAKIGDERIYAFALVTDSDCTSLFMAVNTVEYLISYGGPQSPAVWLPDEWGYSDSDSGELSKLSGLLLQHSEQLPGQDFFVDALISAIKQLKAAGVFGEHTDDITYFVSMSDADAAERIEDYSAKQLNSPVMASIFLNRNK